VEEEDLVLSVGRGEPKDRRDEGGGGYGHRGPKRGRRSEGRKFCF
jgi:hypothetical protein